jgi:biotin carboxyl carrier protein
MYELKVNGTHHLEIDRSGNGFTLNGKSVEADIQPLDSATFQVLYQGASYTVHVMEVNREAKVALLKIDGKLAEVALTTEMDRILKKLGLEGATAKVSDIKAPMPGLIHSVKVEPGQQVSKGDPILILEAMKMENLIKAPADGVIGKIHVEKGQNVEKGALLVSLK